MSAIKYQKTGEFGIVPFATRNPATPGCRIGVSLLEFEGDEIPALGTRLADAGLNIIRKGTYWDNHVFAGVDDGPQGFMNFIFNPPTGDVNNLQPFNAFPDTMEFTWPAVLIDIGVIQYATQTPDSGSGQKVSVAPKYMHVEKLPSHATEVWIEEYLSNEPFPSELTVLDPPVPTPIDTYVNGQAIRFPACLHPAISVDAKLGLEGFGDGTTAPNSFVSYLFLDLLEQVSGVTLDTPYYAPATNHLRWRDFVNAFKVEKTPNNQYYGRRYTFRAPPPGRAVFS